MILWAPRAYIVKVWPALRSAVITASLLATVVLSTAESANAQGLPTSVRVKIGAEAWKALRELKAALDDLNKVRQVVEHMERNEPPGVEDNEWSDLAEKYRRAAADIQSASLPSRFDRSEYAFSFDELRNCETRPQALAKARAHESALRQALQETNSALSAFGESLRDVRQSQDNLRYLIRLHEEHPEVMALPVYGEIFKWNWFDLNTTVSNALGMLNRAITERRTLLQGDATTVRQSLNNLSSNLKALETLPCQDDASSRPAVRRPRRSTVPPRRSTVPLLTTTAQCANLSQLDALLNQVNACKAGARGTRSVTVRSCMTWWLGWPTSCVVPAACTTHVDQYYALLTGPMAIPNRKRVLDGAARAEAVNGQLRNACAGADRSNETPR